MVNGFARGVKCSALFSLGVGSLTAASEYNKLDNGF